MSVHTTNGRNMRKLFIYILIPLLVMGCDIIPKDEQLIPVDMGQSARKHVLIEFTGFRCVNCPLAAEMAQDLAHNYDGELYVVSLHPASNPFTQGKYDYTCSAADSIYRKMGGDASTPFPTGNVNMQLYQGEWFIDMNEWATAVYSAMRDTISTYIQVSGSIPDSTETCQAVGNVHLMPDTQADIAYWLVEDSVLGVQAMPDNTVNMEYYHRHMLRAVANDRPFGTPAEQNNSYVIDIPDVCNTARLSVLILLLDPTDKHIIQAYEKKLTDFSAIPNGNE